MQICQDKCFPYKAKFESIKVKKFTGDRKFCKVCAEYLVMEGSRCLCCRTKLRVKARNKNC